MKLLYSIYIDDRIDKHVDKWFDDNNVEHEVVGIKIFGLRVNIFPKMRTRTRGVGSRASSPITWARTGTVPSRTTSLD